MEYYLAIKRMKYRSMENTHAKQGNQTQKTKDRDIVWFDL